MEIIEEWAGCNLALGLTGSKSKGLASWAVAWGLEADGNPVMMEIWRENEQTLFQGRQTRAEDTDTEPLNLFDTLNPYQSLAVMHQRREVEAIKSLYQKAVEARRTAGFIAVKFNDLRHGNVPSFSEGEGVRIAAAGAIGKGRAALTDLTPVGLEGAMKSFSERLKRSWTGAANAQILLGELKLLRQGVEAYCDNGKDRAVCEKLIHDLDGVKAAAQEALTN